MKRELLSKAFGDIDEAFVQEAYRPVPADDASGSPGRIVHMNRKRIITFALAAALMLSLGIAAYAVAGIPRWTATRSMENTGEYTDLADLEKVGAITGYEVCLPEAFSDGFAFSKLSVDGEAVYDEGYHELKDYYTVHAAYTSAHGAEMLLTLTPVLDLPDQPEPREASFGRVIGETEVRIYRDHYKFVPEDYEKSSEDLAAEESGHYYVSFGADEIQERDIASADLVLKGVTYTFYFDDASACTDDMLIRMATELITAAGLPA